MDVLLRYRSEARSEWSQPVVLRAPDGRTLQEPFLAPGVALPGPVTRAIEEQLSAGPPPDGLREEWLEFSVGGALYSFTTITPQLRLRS